nr:hypothetical protein [Tanacetum cinerariifolium]
MSVVCIRNYSLIIGTRCATFIRMNYVIQRYMQAAFLAMRSASTRHECKQMPGCTFQVMKMVDLRWMASSFLNVCSIGPTPDDGGSSLDGFFLSLHSFHRPQAHFKTKKPSAAYN